MTSDLVPVAPLIDGAFVSNREQDTVDVINPSTRKALFRLPCGSEEDVDRAVAAARNSFERGLWNDAPPSHRKAVLKRFADLVAASAQALDALDAEEMGKPLSESFCNATAAADLIRFNAEAVDKLHGDVLVSDKNSLVTLRFVARGVVGAIVPWNFPTFVAAMKIAPALAAGNSLVLKPSEMSSRSAIALGQLALEAGVPAGVLNVIIGLGGIVGKRLGLHPDVDMITFTGSTEIGRCMLQYSGQSNMKPVMTECGGKSPHIVFGDGHDLNAVAALIAKRLITNQGQICSVGSRLVVERGIERELCDLIAGHLKTVTVGDACDPRTSFGPLASERQFGRVAAFVQEGQRDGALLHAGGEPITGPSDGFFFEPTIFRHVAPSSRLAQEEIFGPVLSTIPFDTEEEALAIANNSKFGLLGNVWTTDVSKGMRLARRLRSSVRLNASTLIGEGAGHAGSSEPAQQSGIGAEGGLAGLQGYCRRQFLALHY